MDGKEEEVENDRVSGSTICVWVWKDGGEGIIVNQEFYSYHVLQCVIRNLQPSWFFLLELPRVYETTFCQYI